MGGTLVNMIAVAIGSAIGLLVGSRLSQNIQQSVVTGLGLITAVVGLENARATGNIILPLLSIALGVIIGELLDLDGAFKRLGGWLQTRFGGGDSASNETEASATIGGMSPRERFITGFVTASLVFCVGPLAFLGSIQDGMGLAVGFQQLAIKSALDFFASMAFAASFGVGVAFSIVTILVVQGGLALLGSLAGNVMSEVMVAEMTATGGVILLGLALVLLDVKHPRIANFLPALLVAPLLVALAGLLGIDVYPL